jgi:hypothetical protein
MSDRNALSRSPSSPIPGAPVPRAPQAGRDPHRRPSKGWPVGVSLLGAAALLMASPLPASAQSVSSQSASAPSASAGRAAGIVGHGGTRWSTDYGIGAGRCDRDAIVVDATPGGKTLVQRHEENLRNRSVGIIGATPGTGLLLSTRLGGRLDERDRRCVGHMLEVGVPGRQVGWTNGTTRQSYVVAVSEYTPTSAVPSGTRPGANERCRVLLLTTTGVGVGVGARVGAGAAGRGNTETLVACEANPGVWSIR